MGFLGTIFDAIVWILVTGWNLWAGLFAWLPYGDPLIAIFAAMMVCYVAHRVLNPPGRRF